MHSTFQAAQVRPAGPSTTVPDAEALLAEFAANPWGPHGDALQAALNRLRGGPVARKLVLVMVEPHRAWRLARLPTRRGEPLEPLPGPVYTALADAEVAAFRLRLSELAT